MRLIFGRNLASGFGYNIVNAGELNLTRSGKLSVKARVFLAERTGAENRNFDE